MNYRQLQQKLKVLRNQGKIEKSFKLNQKKTILEAKWNEVMNRKQTIKYENTRITKTQMEELFKSSKGFVLRNSEVVLSFERVGKSWKVLKNNRPINPYQDDIVSQRVAMMEFDHFRCETQLIAS